MPEVLVGMTVGSALAGATDRLAKAGCDTPRLDAELLLAQALEMTRAKLFMDHGADVSAAAAAHFSSLIARRARREPVAYILSRKEFRRIELKVDPRVLIPRPETELLVEVGLSLEPGSEVVDVGTGSGAVALALKHERPDLRVTGVDISPGALALARENASRLALDVRFVEADLVGGVSCDAVLANLPYVSSSSEALAPEIANYEPNGALFAGPDGLEVIRRLVAELPGAASLVALEVGSDHAPAVCGLLRSSGFRSLEVVRDLAGHERVVVGRR